MKKLMLILGSSILLLINLQAQYTLQGTILNHDNQDLEGATVVLVNAIDSTMVTFSISDRNGQFKLFLKDSVKSILQVSYVGYQNYSQALDIDWTVASIKVAPIVLHESSEVLQEVTIKAEHIPMGVQGDTVTYNASAFKTKPNATVEDLLKRLPGVEVERDGSIRAQGKKVENVYVDGKSFFGKDHRIATKNLDAEAVDKVEVYDKKSALAEFTGIDDGEKEKTINLKLKDGHKKGGFGNIAANLGTNERYKSKLNYFRFAPQLQLSLILSSNNLNEQIFSLQDRIQFAGGIGNMVSGGNNMIKLTNNQFGLRNEGENKAFVSGLNFNYDFSDNLKLNSHFLFKTIENDLHQQTSSQNFTNTTIFETTQTLNQLIKDSNQQANIKFVYTPNPFTKFIWKNHLNFEQQEVNQNSFEEYFQSSTLLGNTLGNLNSNLLNHQAKSQFSYQQKFNKKGRNWINSAAYQFADRRNDDWLNNQNQINPSTAITSQNQTLNNKQSQISFHSNYTEPLRKKLYLGIHFKHLQEKEKPQKNFYEIVEKQHVLNEDLSRDFYKNFHYQQIGLQINRVRKMFKIKAGFKGQLSRLEGVVNNENEIGKTYRHLLPFVSIKKEFGGLKNLDLSYTTQVAAPNLNDLMPVQNNLNPNEVFIGNPNLTPSYTHRLQSTFFYFDRFNFVNFWGMLSSSFSKNRITYKTSFSEDLFKTISPVNSSYYGDVSLSSSFSSPIRPLKINYKLFVHYQWSTYDSYLNDSSTKTTENIGQLKMTLENRNKEHFFLETGIGLNYRTQGFSINPSFDQRFFNLDYFISSEVYLGKDWVLSADFNYKKYSNEQFAAAPDFVLLNASIQKIFLNGKWELAFSAYDLLNQNIGFQRTAGVNTLLEKRYNTLGQYFMLGLKYKIGKKKTSEVDIEG